MAIRRYYRQVILSKNFQGKLFVCCDDCYKELDPKEGITLKGVDGEVSREESCYFCSLDSAPITSGVRDTSLAAWRLVRDSGVFDGHESVVNDCVTTLGSGMPSRDDLADWTGIRLASICGVVNKMIKDRTLMDWRTKLNPRTHNQTMVHVVELYNPNDLGPEQSRLV